MKQVRKRFLALLACAALCLPQVVSPAAATDGVTVWSDQIGGSTAKIVSIQMKQGRTGEIMLANDSVVSTTSGEQQKRAGQYPRSGCGQWRIL